mgnify:CR=1 FL=1
MGKGWYSNEDQSLIDGASDVARELHSPEVGPDHLLLSILKSAPPGLVKETILACEIGYELVKKRATRHSEDTPVPEHLPWNRPAQNVLEAAWDIAFQFGSEHCKIEHIFYALLQSDRFARNLLQRAGYVPEEIMSELERRCYGCVAVSV